MTHETITRQWRVPRTLPLLKLVAAGLLLALGLLLAAGDLLRPVLGVLGATALTAWAVRDLVAPVRLAVGADGITVLVGWRRRQRLPWSAVEGIRVERRPGRGFAGPALEIDTGDSLHLFSRLDLGADPAEVADALHAARPPHAA